MQSPIKCIRSEEYHLQFAIWFQTKIFKISYFNPFNWQNKRVDSENFACGIFVELQKAFDTLDHDNPIKKIKSLWH